MRRFNAASAWLAALALSDMPERLGAAMTELPPAPKDRSRRGPSMHEAEPYGASSRNRAQWKDERQRRGRQR